MACIVMKIIDLKLVYKLVFSYGMQGKKEYQEKLFSNFQLSDCVP